VLTLLLSILPDSVYGTGRFLQRKVHLSNALLGRRILLSGELAACPELGAFRSAFRGCILHTNAACSDRAVCARRSDRRQKRRSAFSYIRDKQPQRNLIRTLDT
jgi:hypothetical protein